MRIRCRTVSDANAAIFKTEQSRQDRQMFFPFECGSTDFRLSRTDLLVDDNGGETRAAAALQQHRCGPEIGVFAVMWPVSYRRIFREDPD
jgi:hypothetical protein